MRQFLIPTLCLLLAAPALAAGPEVIRHKPANSNFPIATAVEVPAGRTVVYVSGQVPAAIDPAAVGENIAYGDTKTQTISVMNKIKAVLEGMNLKMGDVVKMQVFLAGDPAKGGKMDFAGFMEGYSMYFGTAEQPNLPARSTMQVAALVNPAYLVEIEVTAVRP
jgi:enamine deaminase RidA (YjgF/YER057c/UK114 family)